MTFAAIGRDVPDGERTRALLEAIWAELPVLGMTEPVFDAPTEAPTLPEEPAAGFELLAGRGRPPSADEVWQALLFARHDVLGIAAALASNRAEDGVGMWPAFRDAWRTASRDPEPSPTLLGEALVFFAHARGAAEQLPGACADLVPTAVRAAGLPCWDPWLRTNEGFVLWGAEEPTRSRVVAALVPEEQAAAFSAWAWWDPVGSGRDLPPFGVYLLHGVKLRYEQQVHALRRRDLHERMERVETGLELLLARHAEAAQAGPGASGALVEAQAGLLEEQSHRSGMAESLSMLDALKHTVEIAADNLQATAPWVEAESAPGARHVVARDKAIARPLLAQIYHDVAYGRALAERAQSAFELTALRLQHAGEVVSRAQARATLIQTTVLAALLAGLGAIQTFSIRFEPDPPLKPPLLAVLVGGLTAVPLLVAHWHERYDAVDRTAAAAMGAAVAWLGLVGVWRDAPWIAEAIIAAVGAGAGFGLSLLQDARRR